MHELNDPCPLLLNRHESSEAHTIWASTSASISVVCGSAEAALVLCEQGEGGVCGANGGTGGLGLGPKIGDISVLPDSRRPAPELLSSL